MLGGDVHRGDAVPPRPPLGNHLRPGGDFRRNLEAKARPDLDLLSRLLFVCCDCSWLRESFSSTELRAATQALEHEVHCIFATSPSVEGVRYQIVSDTERTMPRRFRGWETVRARSGEVAAIFRRALAENSSLLATPTKT